MIEIKKYAATSTVLKVKPEPLDMERVLWIEKISADDFPYEDFKYVLKYQDGHLSPMNCPKRTNEGFFRSNVFYFKTEFFNSGETGWLNRGHDYYSLNRTIQDTTDMSYKERRKITEMYLSFIDNVYKYQHKELSDIRELTIAKMELELL